MGTSPEVSHAPVRLINTDVLGFFSLLGALLLQASPMMKEETSSARGAKRARDAERAAAAEAAPPKRLHVRPAAPRRDPGAAAGDGWLREGVAAVPYRAAGCDDISRWGGGGRACAPALETHSGGECGVYRAIAASGILTPRVERSCASKKGGRAARSASVSDGVGSPRRAYSVSGSVSRTDNPLVRWRCRR